MLSPRFTIEVNHRAIAEGHRKVDWKRVKPKVATTPEGFEAIAFDIPLEGGKTTLSSRPSTRPAKASPLR